MHAACSGLQSRANVNACTAQPSGTSNLATIVPGCSLTLPRTPGRRPDADPARVPDLSHAIIMTSGYDIPPPPGQPGRKFLLRPCESGALLGPYADVLRTDDH